ncbi:MAG: zeta toxin family protein [Actinomycetota bacterium]
MPDPVLHLIAGPNGSGKSTLWELVLGPVLLLEFVNADAIAAQHWPDDPMAHAYEASTAATERRAELIAKRRSFATETVFSHDSKIDLVTSAAENGYLVTLHIVAVPLELAVARVSNRVENGGHAVPLDKIQERYGRLWGHLARAITVVEQARVYDNSAASKPFRPVAEFERGASLWADWPAWMPAELQQATD